MSEDFPALLAGLRAGSLVAGYRLEAQVGAGGMAVVFRARDERLGRLVALKVLAPALAADPAFRRRFIAESRAAAAVDDPHIIPIYEAGEADGVLFIAMRFAGGGDLRLVLQREGALPPGRAAAFISPVASALDAAHGAGLVHRDVKPANILVDARQDRPDHVYLSDFGVSKGAVSSVSLAGTGHFLGTPDYSAPEQIQGQDVDGRTDQYALACVAFQLLTGAALFERDQGLAVLLAHLSAPPPSLCARRPDLPAAADAVLARALAKAPEVRYGSCGDFAGALREALGLAPYHPGGPASASDHPRTEFASPLSVFPGPTAGGTGKAAVPAYLAGAATIDAPASAAEGPGRTADVRTAGPRAPSIPGSGSTVQPTRRPRRLPAMALAGAVLAVAATVAVVAALLASSPSPQRSPSSQGSPGAQRSVYAAASASVGSVAFSPSGATLAIGNGGHIYLWNTATGTRTATLTEPGADYTVNSVAFSPSGATLATADGNGTYLWNTATGTVTATLTDPGTGAYGVLSVAFSPNGAILATGDSDDRTYLWNTATGKLTATLTDPFGMGVTSVAFSPNGATLATADGDDSTYLWNTATGKLTATLTDPGIGANGVASVAFSPNGATVASADGDGSTYLWNTATGTVTATLTDPANSAALSVAFSPNRATVATADGDGSTYLWNTATGTVTATLTDARTGVYGIASVAFSPNGATLATADSNGNAYLWNTATGKLTATLTAPDWPTPLPFSSPS